MNKKKAGFDLGAMSYYGMMFAFISLLIFIVFLFVTDGFRTNIEYRSRGSEAGILISRIIYSPTCFVYYDIDTLRYYPGVIDINRFNQITFDECLDSDKVVSLILKDNQNNTIKQIDNKVKSSPEHGGTKSIFIYDKEINPGYIEILFKDDS